MKIVLGVFLVILLFFLTIFIYYNFLQYKNPQETIGEAERVLDKLTLEQKIGQLFMIGFDAKVLTPEIENLIKKIHPGGILLLQRNIESEKQLKDLIGSLQKIALEDMGLPLFIAVDQEGGLISRIDWVNKTPQSEIKGIEESYQIGKERAEGLKKIGINLNLAPLLDITSPGDFIFERSFQKDPEITGELAGAIIEGQKDGGIFTAIKHFPGYGGISFNPEEKLATLESLPEIFQFQEASESSPEMIMVSNVIYKDIDNNLPFSFSLKGIQYLKDKIKGNYLNSRLYDYTLTNQGSAERSDSGARQVLIISDDLSQNSLLDKFPIEEIISKPFNAGIDILIFSGWRKPVENGIAAFKKEVNIGGITEKRINESVLKIIELKQKLLE